MTTELKPGWRWENFEQLRSTVVTAPNGQEYELRAGDITHPRAQRLLDAMFAALTQRPAAQTEREAFEAEMRCEETWGHRSLRKHVDGRYQNWVVDALWTAWQARASLPAPQQAAPEPVGEVHGWAVTGLSFIWRGEHAQACAEQEAKTCGGTSTAFPLFTRPAPGVPEDVLAILDECRSALMECDRDGDYSLIDRIDALAAAQAKGGE